MCDRLPGWAGEHSTLIYRRWRYHARTCWIFIDVVLGSRSMRFSFARVAPLNQALPYLFPWVCSALKYDHSDNSSSAFSRSPANYEEQLGVTRDYEKRLCGVVSGIAGSALARSDEEVRQRVRQPANRCLSRVRLSQIVQRTPSVTFRPPALNGSRITPIQSALDGKILLTKAQDLSRSPDAPFKC